MIGPPTADLRVTFLRAWAEWDDASSRVAASRHRSTARTLEREADKMETAAGNYAATLGLRTPAFRDLCASWRRAGFSRVEALRAVEVAVADRTKMSDPPVVAPPLLTEPAPLTTSLSPLARRPR